MMKRQVDLDIFCVLMFSFAVLVTSQDVYRPPENDPNTNHWEFGDAYLKTPDLPGEPTIFDKKLKDVIESAKQNMSQGFAYYGLPRLEPFTIKDVTMKTSESLLSAAVRLSRGYVSGLNTFKMNSFYYIPDEQTIVFDISVPSVKIAEYFNADLSIFNIIPVSIRGQTNLNINNIKVAGVVKMGVSMFGASLEGYKVNVDLGDYNVEWESPTDIAEVNTLLNNLVGELSTGWLKSNKDNLIKIADENIKKEATDALNHLTMLDMLSFYSLQMKCRRNETCQL